VKPSNVLIEEGEPVLIDFGLAQLSDDLALTQTGWLLGTPGYLAPEILYGDGPTPAADVHAWAATVTFAAIGRGPYGTGPAMAVMDRERRGHSNLDGVPSGLDDVVAAALRSDPGNRPTARQLVEWLDSRMHPPPGAVAVPAPAEPRSTMTAVEHPPRDGSVPGRRPVPTAALTTAAASPPRVAEGATAVQDAADAPLGLGGEPDVGRYRRVAFWVAMLLVVTAGTVAAPIVTWYWVLAAGWGVRTLWVGALTLRAWRVAHGPRRGDDMLCALLIPWFALKASFASLVNAASAAVVAGSFVALARFGPDAVETPALVAAGLAVGLVSWLGPLSRNVRRGGRLVTDNLPASGLATGIILIFLLGVASGLLAVQQVVGTSYAAFPGSG
jgi:hypothetical protein